MVHKSLNGQSPDNLSPIVVVSSTIENYSLRGIKDKLVVYTEIIHYYGKNTCT